MERIIAQILGKCTEKLMDSFCCMLENGDFTSFCSALQNEVKFAAVALTELFVKETDKLLRAEPERKKHYTVERNRQVKILQTEFGEVRLERTLYQSKADGKYCCLFDALVGIERYQRVENGLGAKLIERAADMSYGKAAELTDGRISRQTVMNLVHKLKLATASFDPQERNAEIVYVEADEDHIHLQNGKSEIVKVLYIHEGSLKISKNRNELINPRYIAGIESGSEKLFTEAMDYVTTVYPGKKIILRGDGGKWIQAGLDYLPNSVFQLDEFHLYKALRRATGSQREEMADIVQSLRENNYALTEALFTQLESLKTTSTAKQCVRETAGYVLNNYDSIHSFSGEYPTGCSAEGHVSHLLSARLSSRPMGWSRHGAHQIAALRAYLRNGGNVLDLLNAKSSDTLVQSEQISKVRSSYAATFARQASIPILSANSSHHTRFAVKNILSRSS